MSDFVKLIDSANVNGYAQASDYIKALFGNYKLSGSSINYAFGTTNDPFEWVVAVNTLQGEERIVSNIHDAIEAATSTGNAPGFDIDIIDISTTFYQHTATMAYETLSRYVGLSIQEASSDEDANSIFVAADSRTAPKPTSGAGHTLGVSTMPTQDAEGSTVTVVFVNPDTNDEKTTPDGGSYPLSNALHEILHSLGLKHPHDGSPLLPARLDYNYYTVMSYNFVGELKPSVDLHNFDVVSGALAGVGNAQTPMALDIYALQMATVRMRLKIHPTDGSRTDNKQISTQMTTMGSELAVDSTQSGILMAKMSSISGEP